MAATPTKVIKVSVFSDITCPWCFIGAKEMDKAIEKIEVPKGTTIKFEIQHKPFLLNPTLAQDDVQKAADYIGERMGVKRWNQVRAMMAERCKQLGLPQLCVSSCSRSQTVCSFCFLQRRGLRIQHVAGSQTSAIRME